MSDDSPKPAIPAWQRAQQPLKPSSDTSTQSHTPDTTSAGPQESTPAASEPAPDASAPGAEEASLPSAEDAGKQADQVKSFLQDPGVRDEPIEKKRAFLASKGIPEDVIDRELGTPPATSLSASDFASFKQTAQQPAAAPVAPARPSGPPIITYPEFLAEAHKPPPIITPSRILNTAYLASGLAAVIYGASTFLVKPMSVSLTESRHDFAAHSNSKIDELNERLSKLVSKLPESKKQTVESDSDDVESITSDPTELFHRDMGTQTSPPLSPRPSSSASATTKSKVDAHNDRLNIISSHLSELLSGVEAGEKPAEDRLEETNKLRNYLDTMIYRSQTMNVWTAEGTTTSGPKKDASEDAIEELKKEIRGVKGVLLSAKRFAPVSGVGRVGA